MELQEFQGLALRTESHISGIKLNRNNLITLLKLVIEVMEILDGIKKAAFYNKTAKLEGDFASRLFAISKLVETLSWSSSGHGPLGAVLDAEERIENVDPRVFHGILGILTESGELAAALLKSVEDPAHKIDAVNIQEEMSDIAWYKAILHDALTLDWGQGLENVINKLRIRYPDKYSDDAADNRDLDAERKALEVGIRGKIYDPLSVDEDFYVSTDVQSSGFDPSEDIQRMKEKIKYEESLGNDTSALKKSLEFLEDAIIVYRINRTTREWEAPAGIERGPLVGPNHEHVADVFNTLKFEEISAEDIVGVQPMTANIGQTFPMKSLATQFEVSDEGRNVFYCKIPEDVTAEQLDVILAELKARFLYTQNYTTPGKK